MGAGVYELVLVLPGIATGRRWWAPQRIRSGKGSLLCRAMSAAMQEREKRLGKRSQGVRCLIYCSLQAPFPKLLAQHLPLLWPLAPSSSCSTVPLLPRVAVPPLKSDPEISPSGGKRKLQPMGFSSALGGNLGLVQHEMVFKSKSKLGSIISLVVCRMLVTFLREGWMGVRHFQKRPWRQRCGWEGGGGGGGRHGWPLHCPTAWGGEPQLGPGFRRNFTFMGNYGWWADTVRRLGDLKLN